MRRRPEITLTYVGSSGRHGSPPLSDELVGVETNLDDVVEQSQQGSQRERRYEDGGEAKLEDCGGERRCLDELQRTSPSKSWHALRLQAYCCTPTKIPLLPISRYSSTSPCAFIGCRFQSLSHCGSWALLSTFCPAPPPFFIFLRDHQFCSKLSTEQVAYCHLKAITCDKAMRGASPKAPHPPPPPPQRQGGFNLSFLQERVLFIC